MTDKEIIKALECCVIGHACPEDCPYIGKGLCVDMIRADALDLINRQKAKIENLGEKIVMQMGLITEQKAEIERLKAEIVIRDKIIDERGKEVIRHDNAIRSLHKQLDNLKAEAINEFAERLKELSYLPNLSLTNMEVVDIATINNLVKEMTE